MKKAFLTLCAAFSLFAHPAGAVGPNDIERPKLVVGIVIDQMRWDYLYRYYDKYTEGGFKRMLNDGFSCENTQLNYVPTVTAIGHTSIYTGSVPAIHGIAGNDFIVRKSGKKIYCTDDNRVNGVGTNLPAGKMSPQNLLVTTIGDELRLATNFGAKVISISLKDRAAILPGGHTANAAYWFDSHNGHWITSTYYMNKLPEWVENLNRTDPARRLLEKDWNTLYPIGQYTQSTADDTPYEKPFGKAKKAVFPIPTSQLLKTEGYGVIRNTPYGNTLTLQMAQTAVINEKLGQGNETDMLAVSCSATDYIGHQFGPNAIETEDTYLRLDQDLADFLSFLDKQVGKENYTLFLTADHAAAHNVRFMNDHDIPAGAWNHQNVEATLDSLVKADFQVEDAVRAVMNYQVFLNHNQLKTAKANIKHIKEAIVNHLQKDDEVAYAVDLNEIATSPLPSPIRERVINGYHNKRSGDIQIVLAPGWYEGEEQGTTHGVWCPYDAHIPLIFIGKGIPHGQTVREIHITDIAPTLAALLKIQMPNGCVGTPIAEMVK